MRRRALIAGLGGAAAWPVVARGQRSKPLIGFLYARSQEDTTEHSATCASGAWYDGCVIGRKSDAGCRQNRRTDLSEHSCGIT